MTGPKSAHVNITVVPVPGNEPDAFEVHFQGADGSKTIGHDLTLPAGKVGTWKIIAKAAESIPAGGGFLFQRHSFLFSHRIQDYNPKGRDFVTLETRSDAKLRLIVNSARQSHHPSFAQVLVEEGEMKAGDAFTIQIGDRSHGGAGSAVYDGSTLGRIVDTQHDARHLFGAHHERRRSHKRIDGCLDSPGQRRYDGTNHGVSDRPGAGMPGHGLD